VGVDLGPLAISDKSPVKIPLIGWGRHGTWDLSLAHPQSSLLPSKRRNLIHVIGHFQLNPERFTVTQKISEYV
jgi:hypothetical protein